MNIPVLLIAFNRPKYVSQLLQALKQHNVKKLYVFKDGPRPNNLEDSQLSREIEGLINNIDWDCRVITNYMQNNLGCGYGPFSAISWAFQYEEELIILEDDCIPNDSFFKFCTKMLEKYKNDTRIRHISGRCQMPESDVFKKYDYIYTQYAPTLGWATWKRTWKDFDIQMRNLKSFFEEGGFNQQFATKQESKFFNKRYYECLKHPEMVFHIWDYQFGLYSRVNGSLGIIPSKNLIKYIGVEGTHSTPLCTNISQLASEDGSSFDKHPLKVALLKSYDEKYFNTFIKSRTFIDKIKTKISWLLKDR